mmetsp:Transcript_47970/g.111946  ORF Transcript_47970/g.111946 Transcript_47970/m.111946 type:complete len:377 (-) Transcript_47970:199-1329(-)
MGAATSKSDGKLADDVDETRPRRCCCIRWSPQQKEAFLSGEVDFDPDQDYKPVTPAKNALRQPCPAPELSIPQLARSLSEPVLSKEARPKDSDVDDEAYFSCDEEFAVVGAVAPTAPSVSRESSPKGGPTGLSALTPLPRFKVPRQNSNRISDFRWCDKLLQTIVAGKASGVAAGPAGRRSTPLFVVAGACPNGFCGMQAVMFSHIETPGKDAGFVDFWWIKPSRADASALEPQTLNLNASGPHRNVPGKSRSIYAPFAEKFKIDDGGDFIYGVDTEGRAYIEEDLDGSRSRMLMYLVWQEAWSGVMSKSKFIRGKICYQKSKPGPSTAGGKRRGFFSREYQIRDGQLSIAPKSEEEEWPSLLPPDAFQEMSTSFQ